MGKVEGLRVTNLDDAPPEVAQAVREMIEDPAAVAKSFKEAAAAREEADKRLAEEGITVILPQKKLSKIA